MKIKLNHILGFFVTILALLITSFLLGLKYFKLLVIFQILVYILTTFALIVCFYSEIINYLKKFLNNFKNNLVIYAAFFTPCTIIIYNIVEFIMFNSTLLGFTIFDLYLADGNGIPVNGNKLNIILHFSDSLVSQQPLPAFPVDLFPNNTTIENAKSIEINRLLKVLKEFCKCYPTGNIESLYNNHLMPYKKEWIQTTVELARNLNYSNEYSNSLIENFRNNGLFSIPLLINIQNKKTSVNAFTVLDELIECWEVLNLPNPYGGNWPFEIETEKLETLDLLSEILKRRKEEKENSTGNTDDLTAEEIRETLNLPQSLTDAEIKDIEDFINEGASYLRKFVTNFNNFVKRNILSIITFGLILLLQSLFITYFIEVENPLSVHLSLSFWNILFPCIDKRLPPNNTILIIPDALKYKTETLEKLKNFSENKEGLSYSEMNEHLECIRYWKDALDNKSNIIKVNWPKELPAEKDLLNLEQFMSDPFAYTPQEGMLWIKYLEYLHKQWLQQLKYKEKRIKELENEKVSKNKKVSTNKEVKPSDDLTISDMRDVLELPIWYSDRKVIEIEEIINDWSEHVKKFTSLIKTIFNNITKNNKFTPFLRNRRNINFNFILFIVLLLVILLMQPSDPILSQLNIIKSLIFNNNLETNIYYLNIPYISLFKNKKPLASYPKEGMSREVEVSEALKNYDEISWARSLFRPKHPNIDKLTDEEVLNKAIKKGWVDDRNNIINIDVNKKDLTKKHILNSPEEGNFDINIKKAKYNKESDSGMSIDTVDLEENFNDDTEYTTTYSVFKSSNFLLDLTNFIKDSTIKIYNKFSSKSLNSSENIADKFKNSLDNYYQWASNLGNNLGINFQEEVNNELSKDKSKWFDSVSSLNNKFSHSTSIKSETESILDFGNIFGTYFNIENTLNVTQTQTQAQTQWFDSDSSSEHTNDSGYYSLSIVMFLISKIYKTKKKVPLFFTNKIFLNLSFRNKFLLLRDKLRKIFNIIKLKLINIIKRILLIVIFRFLITSFFLPLFTLFITDFTIFLSVLPASLIEETEQMKIRKYKGKKVGEWRELKDMIENLPNVPREPNFPERKSLGAVSKFSELTSCENNTKTAKVLIDAYADEYERAHEQELFRIEQENLRNQSDISFKKDNSYKNNISFSLKFKHFLTDFKNKALDNFNDLLNKINFKKKVTEDEEEELLENRFWNNQTRNNNKTYSNIDSYSYNSRDSQIESQWINFKDQRTKRNIEDVIPNETLFLDKQNPFNSYGIRGEINKISLSQKIVNRFRNKFNNNNIKPTDSSWFE